jgi:hypothetical protein
MDATVRKLLATIEARGGDIGRTALASNAPAETEDAESGE